MFPSKPWIDSLPMLEFSLIFTIKKKVDCFLISSKIGSLRLQCKKIYQQLQKCSVSRARGNCEYFGEFTAFRVTISEHVLTAYWGVVLH
jgi:hypothetical protein